MTNLTILTSTYDGESKIRLVKYFEGLKSQSYSDFEIVLCLDGEVRKELYDVIKSYKKFLKIKVIQNPKSNLSNNLNIGLKQIETKFTVRHDTDDISYPNRLQIQLDKISSTKAAVVSGNIVEKTNSEKSIKKVPIGWINKYSLFRFFKNPINHNCCIFETKVVQQFGYPVSRMEDFILWSRLLNSGYRFYNIEMPLLEADALNVDLRRCGASYREAETKLFKENIQNSGIFLAPIIIISYALRYILRLEFCIILLRMALKTSRIRLKKFN